MHQHRQMLPIVAVAAIRTTAISDAFDGTYAGTHGNRRWLGESEQSDKWFPCLKAALMAHSRREHVETITTEPDGDSWPGNHLPEPNRFRQTRPPQPCHRQALLLVVRMALAAPILGAGNSFDGTYTGERVLMQGDAGACVAKDAASATIRGDELTFTNSAVKSYTISFSPRADGAFVQLSANIGGEVVDIRGHIRANVLDADVTSANCAHHWHLEKQH